MKQQTLERARELDRGIRYLHKAILRSEEFPKQSDEALLSDETHKAVTEMIRKDLQAQLEKLNAEFEAL